jgi:hypothetical protein
MVMMVWSVHQYLLMEKTNKQQSSLIVEIIFHNQAAIINQKYVGKHSVSRTQSSKINSLMVPAPPYWHLLEALHHDFL